jgi:pimeloyl-ACP methyl ester carboxylesterase
MNKPILYLLAGNGGAADWWDDVQPYFQHYRVIPLELPGFGDNPQAPCADLPAYAQALLAATEPGNAIFAVGVNALLVLHALQRRSGHFSRTVLLAPVGAFLWQRRLPALMSPTPVRKLVHGLLSHRPAWFASKFSANTWTTAQYQRMGDGYRRCRAFMPYWDMVRADTALPLLEWLTDPIELIWGEQDAVLGRDQAAAWSAILARAQLTVSIMPGWGHYPWIDSPGEFAAWLESHRRGFVAHSKGGRLHLAQLAGIAVPAAIAFSNRHDPRLPGLLSSDAQALWAVRSSSNSEDQADAANAGLSRTFLRVPAEQVASRIDELSGAGVEEVVVQRFVTPLVSGIAFVRHLAVEVEWLEGHLEALADGHCTPKRAIISRLDAAWSSGDFPNTQGLTAKRLWRFLQAVLRVFHYVHGDVEWAWDGQQLWLLQYRPISTYGWRRHLTAANIAEILPPQPSRLVEYAQRRAAGSIPAIMARWDTRVLQDNEPFTALFADASYINNDLFLARLADWGIPASRYAGEVGGATPPLPWRPLRLLRALPIFCRMQRASRHHLLTLAQALQDFDHELQALVGAGADGQQLADWFTRFYVLVVQGNLAIATALAGSGSEWFGQPATVYQDLQDAPHRLPWETDPATARACLVALPQQGFPVWSRGTTLAHRLGLPGMRGHYLQVREWYRDNLMRIFFRLHHALPLADRPYWFAPHEAVRSRTSSFWQDGQAGREQAQGFLIYPGRVAGVLGRDILLEDSLDPGRYQHYQAAQAVIARMGGRLSHGATLLRELRKPSAVLPDIDPAWLGEQVVYHDGVLKLAEK